MTWKLEKAREIDSTLKDCFAEGYIYSSPTQRPTYGFIISPQVFLHSEWHKLNDAFIRHGIVVTSPLVHAASIEITDLLGIAIDDLAGQNRFYACCHRRFDGYVLSYILSRLDNDLRNGAFRSLSEITNALQAYFGTDDIIDQGKLWSLGNRDV
jgi:hypothetical protein